MDQDDRQFDLWATYELESHLSTIPAARPSGRFYAPARKGAAALVHTWTFSRGRVIRPRRGLAIALLALLVAGFTSVSGSLSPVAWVDHLGASASACRGDLGRGLGGAIDCVHEFFQHHPDGTSSKPGSPRTAMAPLPTGAVPVGPIERPSPTSTASSSPSSTVRPPQPVPPGVAPAPSPAPPPAGPPLPGPDGAPPQPPTYDTQLDCGTTPIGAPAGSKPQWCGSALTSASGSFTQGVNSWRDDFGGTSVPASINDSAGNRTGYFAYENKGSNIDQTEQYRTNGHWDVDAAGTTGGALIRPDRSFQFVNGKITVEADASVAVSGYAGNAWTELVVTTASAPSPPAGGLFARDIFNQHDTFSCILYSWRSVGCALVNNSNNSPEANYVCKASSHEDCGTTSYGGDVSMIPNGNSVWHQCGTNPESGCRDRFRMELTRDSISVYVNDVLFFQQTGLVAAGHALPVAMVAGNDYVYFGSWVYATGNQAVRFHWGHVAVN